MTGKKKWMAAALVCAVLLGTAGCGGAEKKEILKNDASAQVVTDISGTAVTVPAEVKKLAVVPLPWASVVYALDGSSSRLAAIHPGALSAYKGHFLEKLDADFGKADSKLIGSDFSLNAEGAAAAGIDAAILWSYQDKEAEKLSAIGIPAVRIDNADVAHLKDSFAIVGKLLGKEERAAALSAYYDNAYNDITKYKAEVEAAKKTKLLFLRNAKLTLQGNDNFMHEAIELGGGEMPFAQVSNGAGNPTVQMEEIYKLDPDIILLSNFDKFVPENLYENRIAGQDWSTVRAVKERRVYKVPMGIYRWDAPGVETPLMMKWLAQLLQPDIFKDLHVKEETKAFYRDFLHHELTEAELDEIFAAEANAKSLPLSL